MARARFSEVLADRRRQLGLSIGQAAQVLRLRADVLEAFESGDFEAMPKSGYAQGMLSSYARYLDLDPEAIVDMFTSELEDYRRGGRQTRRYVQDDRAAQEGRSSRQTRSGSPYVGRRGLLPTSGGPAGDLGSFATTSSVRSRSAADGSYGQSDYTQGRPYTAHAPYDARTRDRRQASARRNAIRRGERVYGQYSDYGSYESSDNISTMPVDTSDFEDDLGFSNDARPYRAASTAAGRHSSRDMSPAGRPNVRRRQQPSSRRNSVRRRGTHTRGRSSRSEAISDFFADPVHAFITVGIAVALVLTIVIIFSVSSCVSTAVGDNSQKSVPVSTASSSDTSSSDSSASSSSDDSATRQKLAAADAQDSSDDSNTETDVTVSVADGAVTWLEIECDGTSEVADTVTGPWENTYVVTDSITIQAGDTTAVTVTKNGKQVQFDSLSSGVGSVTIQGTKVTADSSSTTSGTSGTTTDTTGSTSTGSGSSSKGSASTGKSTSSQGSSTKSSSTSATSGSSSGTSAKSTKKTS
ncbi:MAG: helix-turn-helix domain-containing protein [Atopobiaceae bacterium]